MTDLLCTACGKTVDACACPDMDARLRESMESGNIMLKWCPVCERHFARCGCEEPLFVVMLNNEVITDAGAVTAVFKNALGRSVEIDLTSR